MAPHARYRKLEFKGMPVVVCDDMPKDEVWFVQGREIVGKIVNIAPSPHKEVEDGPDAP